MTRITPDTELTAHLVLPSRRLLAVGLSVTGFFALAYAASILFVLAMPDDSWRGGVRGSLVRLFDLNSEVSLPKWWAVLLLLGAAALLGYIAHSLRAAGDPDSRWWQALAIIFVIAAIDEGAQLHEVLGAPMRWLFANSGPGWVIPLGALLVGLVIVFARFYFRLPLDTRVLFAVALFIFVVGAVGMELLSWSLVDLPDDVRVPWQYISMGIEETLEATGATLFVYALARYLRDHVPESGRGTFQVR